MTEPTITPAPWPNTGEPNRWFIGASAFMNELATAPGFWCFNHNFKYLTIRVDTRDHNHFKVFIDGNDGQKIEVSADDVIEAVHEWQTRFSSLQVTPDALASQRDVLLSHAKSALNMCETIREGFASPDITHEEFRCTVMAWASNFVATAQKAITEIDTARREGKAA